MKDNADGWACPGPTAALACDHDATRASFAAFFGATVLIGGQDLPGEGWVLMGNCVACNSTLTIPIAEPRGHAVHGLIDRARELAEVTSKPLTDAEERALRKIVTEEALGQDVIAVPQRVTSEITPAGRRFFGATEADPETLRNKWGE